MTEFTEKQLAEIEYCKVYYKGRPKTLQDRYFEICDNVDTTEQILKYAQHDHDIARNAFDTEGPILREALKQIYEEMRDELLNNQK